MFIQTQPQLQTKLTKKTLDYYLGDLGQFYSTSFIFVETFNQDSRMAKRVSRAFVIREIP